LRLFRDSTKTKKGRLRKIVTFVAVMLVASFVLILVLALDSSPRPNIQQPVNSSQAKQAATLLKRSSHRIFYSQSPSTISASENELNSALALINKTFSSISGDIKFTQEKSAEVNISFRLTLLGRALYLNCSATLLSSKQGIEWQNGKIGQLPLSKQVTDILFRKIIELAIGKSYGREVLASISDVHFQDNKLALIFERPEGFQAGIAKAARRLSAYTGKEINFNVERVQHYLDFLTDLARNTPRQKVSLSFFLTSLVLEARSQTQILELQPHEENTAALYALGIQSGPGIFRHFIANLSLRKLHASPRPRLTIDGREDLAKHFIYSAALKILSDKGVSFSLGETKEIIDANGGGSGFSFADIAADKSGIRFTDTALDSTIGASLLQEYAVLGINEADFIPSIRDLPEGLSESVFKQRFLNTESQRYKLMMEKIDQRINTTSIAELMR